MDDICIRPMCQEDCDELYEVRLTPRAARNTMALPSLSREKWAEQVKRMVSEPDSHQFVALVGGKVVGMAGLHRYQGRKSHVAGMGMSVHDEYQGRGVGTRLMEALIDLADNWLMLYRLELEVYPDNEPALRLYRRFGFQEEGRKRAGAVRDGEYIDILMMSRLRPGG